MCTCTGCKCKTLTTLQDAEHLVCSSVCHEVQSKWPRHFYPFQMLCRLRESESTLQKRLTWARAQTSAAAAPGLFDFSLQDTSRDEAYTALKGALAMLSPEVRRDIHNPSFCILSILCVWVLFSQHASMHRHKMLLASKGTTSYTVLSQLFDLLACFASAMTRT